LEIIHEIILAKKTIVSFAISCFLTPEIVSTVGAEIKVLTNLSFASWTFFVEHFNNKTSLIYRIGKILIHRLFKNVMQMSSLLIDWEDGRNKKEE
jgi:hypothetical protein